MRAHPSVTLFVALVVTCSSTALLRLAADEVADRAAKENGVLVVKTPVLHIGDGRMEKNAVIVIADGRIRAAGTGVEVPEGARVIEIDGSAVTPGLIDANAIVEPATTPTPPRRRRHFTPENRVPEEAQERARAFFRRVFGSDPHAEHSDREPEEPPNPDAPRADCETDRGTSAKKPLCVEKGRHSPSATCPVCSGRPHGKENALAPGVKTIATSEQSSEVVPHTRVIDTVNLDAPDFARLLRGGVTTVYVSPDPSAVIGPRGAVVKTAGARQERILVEAGATKATMGIDPSFFGSVNRRPSRWWGMSMYVRRPTTRMGVTWVFRKAFYDTIARRSGLTLGGADTPSDAALDALEKIVDGSVPLRIQARRVHDIASALRLSDEFNLNFTLEGGTDAFRHLDQLKARSVPVIFGPIEDRATGIRRYSDRGDLRFSTFKTLLDAGIVTALSAQDLRDEDGLARQAMYAKRFGVSLEAALASVTSTPARLLGIDNRVGTVEVGKDADLVVWNGPAFAATAMPAVVIVNGQVVVDQRRARPWAQQ